MYQVPQTTDAAVEVEITELVQKGCLLNAKLTVSSSSSLTFTEKTSRELVINDAVAFQVRLVVVQIKSHYTTTYNNLLFVKFTKSRLDDDLNYTILFNCADFNVTQTFTTDNGTWHLVHQNKTDKHILSFNVSVEMHLKENASPYAALHDDTELTDFELRGKDGSVRVHRTVLAAASPVLRRMMSGAWREASEGHVDVSGTSRATLEHLKNYIYLHELPQTGLEQLLLLSCYYMMPELERRCVDMLVRDLDSRNACDLIQFAAKNNVTRLLLAVLECVQSGAISVSEIRDHLGERDETKDE
ncbi:hypothetical protein PYW07_005617 [Mythimna separata]|uniref:BTB domain-containing protein n=1 Tax=Mythimna separata TaxID=271217 RepID=A0AAD7YIL3_MYTSE|nr:hypothetical protein PYW07_005617 [Mythimna separata]